MSERRLTIRLRERWDATRKNKTLPQFDTFEMEDLADVWPYCLLVSLTGSKREALKCQHMGERIVAICGRDLKGKKIDANNSEFPDAVLFSNLEAVCKELVPIEGSGMFFAEEGVVKWRAIFLPLGDSKKKLTHILVGFSFKQG